MIRIAVAGLQHETNTFVAETTGLDDFRTPAGWPELSRGPALVDALAASAAPMAGALAAAAEAPDVEIVPTLWALALPGGRVTDETFEGLAGEIVDAIASAHRSAPLDGVYLDLHGAMVTDGFDDGEGALLARLREAVGPDLPIAASLDLHANPGAEFVAAVTILDAYRTYPHVDMAETGARTMRRLLALLGGGRRPLTALRRPPFQIALPWQSTLASPARDLIAEADRRMAADPDLAIVQIFGFPLADVPEAGPAVIVQHPDGGLADAVAAEMQALWLDAEAAFDGPLPDAAGAAAQAIALAAAADGRTGPVVIADTQDNPGGGGPGDTTGLLRALIDAGAAGAVMVHIADPMACAAAHAAGVGAVIDTAVGGQTMPDTGAPVPGPWTVRALGDGRFTGVGPMYAGNPIDLGPVALLERAGVRVIVAPRRMQASEPALLHHLGLDPATLPILALKSSVHFRGAYQAMAKAILVARAPGPVAADLSELPYRNLRPGLRLAGRQPAALPG